MAAIIQINSGTPGVSNDNLPLDTVVTLTSVDAALHSYTWSIVSQPEGPLDAIVGSGQIVTFTPTKEGSYLVKLTVDFGYPSEDSQQLIAAVRELETGNRIPAIGETTENSVNDGWANPVDAILQRVTRFTDAGVQPGAAAEALAVGDVVYASDTYTLAAGLPDERVVAKWAKAHANVVAEVQGVYGVVAGSVLGGSIATDDVITVQTTGLYAGVPFASAPTVGDPVYISDLGGLSLTAGTIKRQIGTVCSVDVGASTYDIMVGPAPAEVAPPNLYAKTYFVATSGSDLVGDGSIANPFATPQKAHDVAIVNYPTDYVAVEIGPGNYTGDLTIEKWNIVFHGSGSRPETQATKLLGSVTVTPDGATQKFNDVIGLDRLFVEPPSVGGGGFALGVTGTGAFSLVVTDCYLTTGDATSTCAVLVEPSNAIRPRVTFNDCVISVQAAGPDIIVLDRGDVRMSGVQALFGSTVPSGSAGKGVTVNNNASLFADRLLLDVQTLGPAIEVTGSYAGTKLTLSSSSITMSYATCGNGMDLTNGSAGQLSAFVWDCIFGVTNLASKAINGTGSLGSNLVVDGQLSFIYGTSSAIGSTVTMLPMTGDIAGGDLSGNLPSPTVAKLQGRAVSSTAPTSGQVLKYNGTAWAPAADSTAPTGSAGGVLGYTGSTYPNPNGLAPVTGNTIPVKGTAAATTTFQVDGSTGGTQAPSLSLRSGANGGAGLGGDAKLEAGTSTSGAGGTARVVGGDGDNQGGSAQLLGGDSSAGEGATIDSGGADLATGGGVTVIGGPGPVGGAVSITGGQGNTTDGGAVAITGGIGTAVGGTAGITGGAAVQGGGAGVFGGEGTTGNGGNVVIKAGNSTSGGDGGVVSIDAGTGTTNGNVSVGPLYANRVSIGRGGCEVTTKGINVESVVTHAPVAGTTIPVVTPTIILNAAAPVTMTATPTLQTSGITAGTRLTLIGGTNAVTFQRESALAGSKLRLGSPTQAIDNYDVMTMIFDGTDWRELSLSLNS